MGESSVESRESRVGAVPVRDFRDLLVWQRAMVLAQEVYRLTDQFPKEEQYGLVSQMRRAAVSIASNIAEGNGRESPGDFLRFIRIARGSLAELQTHLILSERLGFSIQATDQLEMTEELARMLRGMQRSLDSQLSTLG